MSYSIAALYRFVALDDLAALRQDLLALCRAHDLCGTLLIAHEGINGTIAGPAGPLAEVVDALDRRFGIKAGEVKFSTARERPFRRMKVRIRPEIITMRAPEANPGLRVGAYVMPADWNAIIEDPEMVVVDTRNRYETRLGTFKGARDPGIDSFTEFKRFVADELDPSVHRKVAMFCTGGIRCEKASAYMLAAGFEAVFHLKGGILQYLEDVEPARSLWQGDCYVFDERVAVGHGLGETAYFHCFGCGETLAPEDAATPDYEKGVSCRHCIAGLTPQRAAGLRQRQRQRA